MLYFRNRAAAGFAGARDKAKSVVIVKAKSVVIFSVLAAMVVVGPWSAAEEQGSQPTGPASPQWPAGTAGPQAIGSDAAESAAPAKEVVLTAEEAERDRVLRERIRQRWDAVMARDFAKAYTYETPEYRKAHTAEEFAGGFGGMVKWFMATVKEVRYDRVNEAEVVVALDVSFPLAGGGTARTTVDTKEQWVYLEDQWWRRNDRIPLGSAEPSEPSPQK